MRAILGMGKRIPSGMHISNRNTGSVPNYPNYQLMVWGRAARAAAIENRTMNSAAEMDRIPLVRMVEPPLLENVIQDEMLCYTLKRQRSFGGGERDNRVTRIICLTNR